jgi:hypothetical protein
MRAINIFLLTAACLLPVSHASAQSSDIERRVDSLERKMDAILDILQKQSKAGANTPKENGVASSDVVDGYVPGIYLDVFAPASTSLLREEIDRSVPQSTPSASISILPASKITYAEIINNEETKRFTVDELPALVIGGYLKILKSGTHAIGMEIVNEGGFRDNRGCVSKFMLSGKLIASGWAKDNFLSKTSNVSLTPGLYEFKLFFECARGVPRRDEGKSITLVMAEPGERAPKAISADRFFIKQ